MQRAALQQPIASHALANFGTRSAKFKEDVGLASLAMAPTEPSPSPS